MKFSFDFNGFKKAATTVAEHVSSLRAEILRLQTERDRIEAAAVTKEEAKRRVAAAVSTQAASFFEGFDGAIQALAGPNARAELSLGQTSNHLFGPGLFSVALAGLVGREVQAAICLRIDGMTWPEGAMSSQDRAKALRELDAKLAALIEEERAAVEAARAAGMKLDLGGV